MSAPVIRHIRLLFHQLDRGATYLTQDEHFLGTQKLFKNIFFSWLFLHTALLLPFHQEVWAPEALLHRVEFVSHLYYHWIFNLANHPAAQPYYLVFVIGQLIALALGVIGVAPRLMNALVFVLTTNVSNLAGVILDGGNNLSLLILFYMMFINTSGQPIGDKRAAPLKMGLTALSNAAFFTCRLQVCIVYVCTAIFKLNGAVWQKGMALYYIFQVDSYTHPWVYNLVIAYPMISFIGTYFTIAFQSLFPILVWFRSTRRFIILAGVTIHLGISFAMGLFTFGLVMCVMYILFFENALSQRLLNHFSYRQPLYIAAPTDNPRLQTLLRWLKRLDWGRLLVLQPWEAPDALKLHQHGAAHACHTLVAFDQATQTMSHGVGALWRVAARLPLCLPLLPLFGLLAYLGLAQQVYQRWSQSASGEELPFPLLAPTEE